MPHLRFRGLSSEKVAELSRDLVPVLSELLEAPEDHFTVEEVSSSFFIQGKVAEADPFWEMCWFDRGQDLQNRVADLITRYLKKSNPHKDVILVFTILEKNKYYENGQHF